MASNHNTYELTYIVNSVISDSQIQDLIKRVSTYVTENGGEVLNVDQWGSRRLAFPIMKKRNGFYVNMYFRAPGSIILRLERALEIDDNVLRYLTMKMDAKMLRHYTEQKAVRSTFAPVEDKPKSDSRSRARSGKNQRNGAKVTGEAKKQDANADAGVSDKAVGQSEGETPESKLKAGESASIEEAGGAERVVSDETVSTEAVSNEAESTETVSNENGSTQKAEGDTEPGPSDDEARTNASQDAERKDKSESESSEAEAISDNKADEASAAEADTEDDVSVTEAEKTVTVADTAKQDITEPDATEADSAKQDITEPDATEADSAKPDATEADTAKPDVAEPDATEDEKKNTKDEGAEA